MSTFAGVPNPVPGLYSSSVYSVVAEVISHSPRFSAFSDVGRSMVFIHSFVVSKKKRLSPLCAIYSVSMSQITSVVVPARGIATRNKVRLELFRLW